jgi:hypothetical protein
MDIKETRDFLKTYIHMSKLMLSGSNDKLLNESTTFFFEAIENMLKENDRLEIENGKLKILQGENK